MALSAQELARSGCWWGSAECWVPEFAIAL